MVQRGFHGFSFADIATDVGIRKASIHHHFPTKVDLVRTLVANYRRAVAGGLDGIRTPEPDPLAQLRAYIGYWERCVTTDTDPFCLAALLAAELPSLPPEVAEEIRGHFRVLAAWFEAVLQGAAAAGKVVLAHPAQVEAEALMAAVHGALLSARAAGDPTRFGIVMSAHLQRIGAGLLQLATAVRRWKSHSGQWASVLSGAQSALAGALFIQRSFALSVPPIVTLAGYAGVGAVYFLISAIWLAVKSSRTRARQAAGA